MHNDQATLERIYTNYKQFGKDLNTFITLRDQDKVLAEHVVAPDGPLKGVPYVLKDAYVTSGIKTTAASHVLGGFIPPYDATVYRKMRDSGAILIGKMNMDAWGHGGSSENTDYGPVKNPWDPSRVAGGSSGGPAAAIAAGMAECAVGEDTGGSIRNPAGWNNITGLKVTYGRVSRYGAIAYASSFDTVGPMAHTAADCARILSVIAGVDPLDATSVPVPVDDYEAHLSDSLRGRTIGFPSEMYQQGLDPEIKDVLFTTKAVWEKLGVKVIDISLPIADLALAAYYLIAPSETSSNLARYDGIRFGSDRTHFTDETMRRIMIGTYALSAGYYDAYYRQALKVRTLLINAYAKAHSQCDAILMPIMPTHPTKIGEIMSDPLANLLADIYTTSQNPVGVPSLALPAGFSSTDLPIGMQLVGTKFSEAMLLAMGHQYQQVTDWHTRRPTL